MENHKSVAEICQEYRLNPKLFYDWKKAFFENAAQIFSKPSSKKKEQEKTVQLETQLRDRSEVIAELLQENIKLKKSNRVH